MKSLTGLMISRYVAIVAMVISFVLATSPVSLAQVTAVEYFFDSDPGQGNGTAITSFTPANAIDINNFPIPSTSLSPGWHLLCVRTKDANDVWGLYESRSIFIRTETVVPTVPPVTSMEYFFDNVTAPGSGQVVSITPGQNIDISGVNLPQNLSLGWHTIHLRSMDQNNVWGLYETRSIFVRPPTAFTPPPPQLTNVEYFFDNVTEPGTGQTIAVSPGANINVLNAILPNSLSLGWHTIHARVKDENNEWSIYETRSVFVRPEVDITPPLSPITTMEYFYDVVTDPGTGQSVTISAGTAVDIPSTNLTNNLSLGWHTLHVRTKNQNEVWGIYETRSVFVRPTLSVTDPQPSPITTIEYFYDNVTEPGTGQTISITPDIVPNIINSPLPNSLDPGWHTLAVRTQNQIGTWGPYETRRVLINSTLNLPSSPIVQFEYFIDDDPGIGFSTLTLTKASATLIDLTNEPLYVNTLSLGSHSMGLRAKNQNGDWSVSELRPFSIVAACSISTPPVANNNVRCNPGALLLTATGATATQVYRWYADNTTFTILFTGATFTTPVLTTNTNYFVSIYDPATFCESARIQVTAGVSGIPKPVLNLNGSLTVCEGNSVTLSAPAGFSSYTWSNGLTTPDITVNTAGSYTVIVSNGTCVSPSSDPFVFAVNPKPVKPVINATGGGSLCGTGSVTLSAPAGFTTYTWSSGQSTADITVNTTGNFTVLVTNSNGCQSLPSDAFTVTSSTISKPVIAVTGNPFICGSASVQLSGPLGFATYLWSNGETTPSITVSTPGNYSLTVSNGSCTSPSSDPVNITVLSVPSKPDIVVTGNTEQCIGDFTVLSAPVGYTNYLWSNGETTRQIVVNAPASFTVQVGNSATCLSVASDPKVITFTGLPCGTTNSPPAPTVGDVSRCDAGSVTFTASGATGSQIYRWYDAPTAGTLLSTGASYSPSVSVTTTFYVLIYDPSTTLSGNRAAAKASIATIPAPVITGPSTISICEGSSTLLSAPLGNVSYLWSNGATSQQIQLSTAGSYSVQVGDGTCQSLSSNTITVSIVPAIAKPLISITGNATLCGSSTVQLSAPVGSYTYNWSNGATSPSITTSIAGNYSVTISNGTCTSPTSDPVAVTSVTILPKPTINTTGNQVLCSGGGFAVLTATLSPFYLWSTGETTRQIVVTTAGNYTVQVGNATNCLSVSSDATPITISGTPCNAGPTIGTPVVINGSHCGTGSVRLEATGATASQSFRWYDAPTGGTLLSTQAIFNTPALSTTTNYYVTIYDAGTESSPATATATIENIPAPTLTGPPTIAICDGSSTLLSAPQGFVQYEWSDQFSSTTQQLLVTKAGSYSVKVGSATCLSPASNIIAVTVSPALLKPLITPNGNITLCTGDQVTLSAPAGYQYLWSTNATSQTIQVSATQNSSVQISNGICTSPFSDNVSVTVLTRPVKPTITVTGNTTICATGFALLQGPSGFSSYLWSDGETSPAIVVTTSGNYSLQVGNSSSCLSVASDPQTIIQSGQPCGGNDVPPAAPATFTQVRCGPGPFTLTGTGAIVNQEYRWYNALTGGSPLFTGQNFNTGFLSTTTGYYLAIRDLSTGLESSRTLVYASVIIINKPVVNPSGSISTCSGNNVLLSGPAGFTQYIWTNTSGNQVGSNQIFSATVSGNYFLEVSNGTCTSPKSDGVTVSVSPVPTKPVIQVISGNTTFCGAGSVELRAPSGFLYTWSTGATTQSITLTESAVITLTTRTGTGCVSPVSDPVVVTKLIPPCKPNTPPLIEPIILSVNIEGSVTVDLLKYIIDGEDNLDYTRIQTLAPTTGKGAPVTIDGSYNLTIDYKGILYSGADRVTLEAYDLFNQKAQRIIEIDVVGEVIVFNGITADGDKINDFLYIQYLDVIQGGLKNKVTILNRWGDTVFEMDDYNNIDRVFSGAGNNGTLLPPGTYFYRIDLSNRKPITGFITLKL